MSDPDALVAAFLAERHVACPTCGYDLHGATEGVCPECAQSLSLAIARPTIARSHAVLLLSLIGVLAVAATEYAVRQWVFVYDAFVDPPVVIARPVGGGGISSITIRQPATGTQIQRALAGGAPRGGWASLPATMWVHLGLVTAAALAAWVWFAITVVRRPFGAKGLFVSTALVVGLSAALAFTGLWSALRAMIDRF